MDRILPSDGVDLRSNRSGVTNKIALTHGVGYFIVTYLGLDAACRQTKRSQNSHSPQLLCSGRLDYFGSSHRSGVTSKKAPFIRGFFTGGDALTSVDLSQVGSAAKTNSRSFRRHVSILTYGIQRAHRLRRIVQLL